MTRASSPASPASSATVLALLAVGTLGCGAKQTLPPDFSDLPDEPETAPITTGPAGTEAEASAAPTTLVAGHAAARYQFAVPPGLGRLRGVVATGADPRELSEAGPDGVGLPTRGPVSHDTIVVFSDSLGLGVDLASVTPALRQRIVSSYGAMLRERFPSASNPVMTSIGPHTAIRVDMPRVEMADRPVRTGRHYLVLDGVVTVAVDCLWTDQHAEQMSRACDAVTASLRRHR